MWHDQKWSCSGMLQSLLKKEKISLSHRPNDWQNSMPIMQKDPHPSHLPEQCTISKGIHLFTAYLTSSVCNNVVVPWLHLQSAAAADVSCRHSSPDCHRLCAASCSHENVWQKRVQYNINHFTAQVHVLTHPSKVNTDIAVRNWNYLTIMGNHMLYRIIQCCLASGSGDFPAFTRAEATQEGCKAEMS